MTYGGFKDLPKRTASENFLRDKVFPIVKKPKCDEYRRDLAEMAYNFLIKKFAAATHIEARIKSDEFSQKTKN